MDKAGPARIRTGVGNLLVREKDALPDGVTVYSTNDANTLVQGMQFGASNFLFSGNMQPIASDTQTDTSHLVQAPGGLVGNPDFPNASPPLITLEALDYRTHQVGNGGVEHAGHRLTAVTGGVTTAEPGETVYNDTVAGYFGAAANPYGNYGKVSALTASGRTATATVPDTSRLATGTLLAISGATPADYNGSFRVTVADARHFTYTMAAAPAAAASGKILAEAYKPDIWAFNALLGMSAGSGQYNSHIAEFDFNNQAHERGGADQMAGCRGAVNGVAASLLCGPNAMGIWITGDPTSLMGTAAAIIDNIGQPGVKNHPIFHGGFVVGPRSAVADASFEDLGNAANTILDLGRHSDCGICLVGSQPHNIINGAMAINTGGAAPALPAGSVAGLHVGGPARINPAPNDNLVIAERSGLADGVAILSTNDTNTKLAGLELGGSQILFSGAMVHALATPASSSAPCVPGAFEDDADYHYVCVARNTWKRVALSAF